MRAMLVSLCAVAACSGTSGTHPTGVPKPPATEGSAAAPVPAAPVLVTWEQLHGPIRSFSITGGEDIDYLRFQPLLNPEVGKQLDRARLRDKLDGAMATQTLTNVDVSAEQLADGIRLVVRVTPQPKVVSVAVTDAAGAKQPVPPELAGAVGARLAPGTLDQVVGTLLDDYHGSGNVSARASWAATPVAGGVAVVLTVEPGEALVIAARSYDGAKLLKPAELDRALEKDLPLGRPWNPDLVARSVLVLETYYWDHGFAEVHVDAAPAPAHGPATVVYKVSEGPVYHLGRIDVSGVPPADAKRYRALMPKLKTGALFNRTDIANARTTVNDLLVTEGHPRANVLPLTSVDQKKHIITLTFEIDLGGKGDGPATP